MRTTILAVVILLAVQQLAGQEWTESPLIPERTPMNSVAMRSASWGVAVGNAGIVRYAQGYVDDTDLRAMLWSSEQIDARDLHDVALLPDQGVIVVGDSGGVWKSGIDGGELTGGKIPTDDDLLCVAVYNNVVVVGGRSGEIWASTNDGSSFTQSASPTSNPIIDVTVDGNGRWMAITETELLRSDDGTTWISTQVRNGLRQHRVQAAYREFYDDWMFYRLGNPWVYEASTDGGNTWIESFPQGMSLRQTHPNARALSMATSDNLFQQSIMFVDDSKPSAQPFHFVSFNAGTNWKDLCTLFFNEFVGTAQAMVNDTTLISTALGGSMLTFTRVGILNQQRWSAPESITIPFKPAISHLGLKGAMVAEKHRTLDKDLESGGVQWSFADQFEDVRDFAVAGNREYMLADTTWGELDGVKIKTYYHSRLYGRDAGSTQWELLFENERDAVGRSLTTFGNKTCLGITAGKGVLWWNDLASAPVFKSFGDTSVYAQTVGVLFDEQTAWVQVLKSTDLQRPFGYYTTDGGESWTETGNMPFYAANAALASDGSIIVTGFSKPSPVEYVARIARSEDQGQTWTVIKDESLSTTEVSFMHLSEHSGNLLAVGPTRIWVSANNGRTWRALTDPPLGAEDGVATGHWASERDVVLYTNRGVMLQGEVDVIESSVNETQVQLEIEFGKHELLVGSAIIQARAVDLTGRTSPLHTVENGAGSIVDLSELKNGRWIIELRTTEGVDRVKVMIHSN